MRKVALDKWTLSQCLLYQCCNVLGQDTTLQCQLSWCFKLSVEDPQNMKKKIIKGQACSKTNRFPIVEKDIQQLQMLMQSDPPTWLGGGRKCNRGEDCCSVGPVPSTVMPLDTHWGARGSYYSHQSDWLGCSSSKDKAAAVYSQLFQEKRESSPATR